jgi:hypothetical protein
VDDSLHNFLEATTVKPAYSILRHDKLKTWGQIANLAGHIDRSIPCQNADPTLSSNNFDLITLTEAEAGLPIGTVARLRIGNQTIRKNAVLACDLMLSVSPEHFRPDNPKEPFYYQEDRVKEWAEACKKWLLDEYGKDRILQAKVHLDEVTPHLHVVYVPLDQKGKLNARGFIGAGRWNMSRLQDRYHAAIAHLGIQRGKRKTKAKYQDIRQFYSDVNRSAEEKRNDWATDISQIALLTRLQQGINVMGAHYSIELVGASKTTLRISSNSTDDERGVLIEQDLSDGSFKRINDQLQQADFEFFQRAERQARLQEIQKAQLSKSQSRH